MLGAADVPPIVPQALKPFNTAGETALESTRMSQVRSSERSPAQNVYTNAAVADNVWVGVRQVWVSVS